jgi:hypothetical protein
MKYHIESVPAQRPVFVPFTVTLTAETPEEATFLHDKIACAIAKSSSFIGGVFRASEGKIVNESGDVPLKLPNC